MQTILFPTDFSENAKRAYKYALHVAAETGASITTLHVYDAPVISSVMLPNTGQRILEQKEAAEKAAHSKSAEELHQIAVAEGLDNVSVTHLFEAGGPIDTILTVAKELDSSVIIMGTKGASGLDEIFVGSVTAQIIELADRPVLAVPVNAVYSDVKNIVYASNYAAVDEGTVSKTLELAEDFKAHVHCIHVNTDGVSEVKQLAVLREKFAEHKNHLTFNIVDNSSVISGINSYVEDNKINMILMYTKKHNFFEKLFLTSYTRKMAFHTEVPLLILK